MDLVVVEGEVIPVAQYLPQYFKEDLAAAVAEEGQILAALHLLHWEVPEGEQEMAEEGQEMVEQMPVEEGRGLEDRSS